MGKGLYRGGQYEFGADYDADTGTVQKVQQAVNAAGYQPPLAVDGSYGPKTKAGIQWIQSQHGLTADGVIGDQTLAALGIKKAAGAGKLVRANVPSIPGLRDVVAQVFPAFSTKYEGALNYMYADSKGLITTGIGNLIDPIGAALGLPWKHSDGSLASQADIADDWNRVKSAYPAIQSVASRQVATLHLDPDAIASLVNGKLKSNVNYLKNVYPNIANWPAAAQLAVNSISWAWGPAFANVWGGNGAEFKAAVNATPPDFAKAADIMATASQHEESINPGIVPRNKANAELFAEADDIVNGKGDPNQLYWPDPVTASVLAAAGIGVGVYLVAGLGVLGWLALKGKL